MFSKDLKSGVLFFFLALGISSEAFRIGIGTSNKPGTGFFPFLGGIVLGIFSLSLVLNALFDKRTRSAVNDVKGFRWRNVLLVAFAILAYSLVLDFLGYFVSTTLLMFFLFRAIEPQSWWIVFLGGLGSSSFSYFLFHVWLKVELPRGLFGF